MARVLVVYGTTEGHTRTVARFALEVVREAGHDGWVADANELFGAVAPDEYDVILVGASVHESSHQRSVENFVQDNLKALIAARSGFFSVSLNAALDDERHRAEAQQYVDDFVAASGWRPDATLLVGGAIRYGRYDFFRRQVLAFVLPRTVGELSEEGDHDFTDYQQVRHFVLNLLDRAEPPLSKG